MQIAEQSKNNRDLLFVKRPLHLIFRLPHTVYRLPDPAASRVPPAICQLLGAKP